MLGSGFQKLAREYQMTQYGGIAYGSLRGYAATLSEGSGYKKVDFALCIPVPAQKAELMRMVEMGNIRSKYNVMNISFGEKAVQVMFRNSFGVDQKIRAFLDWFIPLLDAHGATYADICTRCGEQLEEDMAWVQIHGICYPFHRDCAREEFPQLDNMPQEPKTSYLRGAVGAFLGAILGAVVWAMVLRMGYVAAFVGLLIGWLTERGYDLMKGKQDKGKALILAVAIALGVVMGTLGADAIQLAQDMAAGMFPGFGYWEIPMFLVALVVDNPGFRSALVSNLLQGFLFAGLGAFFMLRQAAQEPDTVQLRYMK